MGGLVYVFDTNIIAELFNKQSLVISKMNQNRSNILCLYEAVDFEVRRGLLHKQASAKLKQYETEIKPLFQWVDVKSSDWLLAANFWADTRRQGRQFSDIDLLLAAVTIRLNAVLVSSDADFDALPVKRENWREA